MIYSEEKYPLQKESYKVIGICMEVHRILGKGLLENVYKDALEYEFSKNNILYEREKKFEVKYKEIILQHHYIADFIVFDKIILEVKAKSNVVEEHFAQVINYLALSKCPLGLLVNFGDESLAYKRIIL
ncbi:MAG: GxxExxY protein [Bacteroidetes bacterium HGW-Bacteroidetes-15]|nr:MAG: GxxExxY protein [Bacteroidetes bacterium HGW-Bacteroidetes-15]